MKNKFVLLAIQTGVALSGQNVNETNGGLVCYFYGRGNNQILAYAPRVELLQGLETPANPLELLGSHFEPLFKFFSGGDKLKFKCENEELTEFLLDKDESKMTKALNELVSLFEDLDLAVIQSSEKGGFDVKLFDNFLEAKTEFAPLEWLHSKIMELIDEDDGDEPQDDNNPDSSDYSSSDNWDPNDDDDYK